MSQTMISISCLQICKSCILLTDILLSACRFPLGTLTKNTSENPPVSKKIIKEKKWNRLIHCHISPVGKIKHYEDQSGTFKQQTLSGIILPRPRQCLEFKLGTKKISSSVSIHYFHFSLLQHSAGLLVIRKILFYYLHEYTKCSYFSQAKKVLSGTIRH